MKSIKNISLIGMLLLFTISPLLAQNVGIGTNNPDESAALEIRSFNKGFLLPVMSSSDRVAIVNPAYGLIVFDATEESLYWRDSTAWVRVIDAQSGFTDGDGDTRMVLEENNDDDIIRFYTNGNEVMKLDMNRLEFLNGGESVFIGESAGENDDLSLNRNTYVGHRAGQLNVTGTQNVALGNQALNRSENGNNNVAVGKQSLFLNEGSNNTAIGFNSGGSNTSGTKNTIVGGNAGFINKTGDQNTFLGYEAGRGTSNLDINGGVMLGHQAGMNETENNRLYIANDNTSEPLIYGQFDDKTATINGMLGINEKNPDGELIINDNTSVDNNSVLAKLRTAASEMVFGFNPTNEGILGSVSNHDLRIRTHDINRMAITKDGDVGIGTTIPKARFHVRENGLSNQRTISAILEASVSKRPTLLFSEFSTSTIDNGMSIEYDGAGGGSQNRLRFNKAGGETALTINNAGNVGIATIAPLSQLDIRRSNNETQREQVHLWQAGDGDANLRFSRGFFNTQSFNIGIDGSDDKLKIASSVNNIIGGLESNTIIEVDQNKEVSLKGDLQLDKFVGSGTRNLKIQGDGKVITGEQFGYFSVELEGTYFTEDAFQTINLELPHGAVIKEIRIVFFDNSSGQLRLEFHRRKFNNGVFITDDLLLFNSSDYTDSPNRRKVVFSANDISFPTVDNDNYTYFLVGFGQGGARIPYNISIKYSY